MAHNRVVVADDSLTVQKVIGLILSPRGYELECFTSGKQAFESIKKDPPLAIIADAMMSDMNAVELGEALKNEPAPINQVPLILLHSSFEKISDEDFQRSGAKEKLVKPFEDRSLIDVIEKYIDLSITEEDEKTIDSSWNMDSFVRPEVPDFKNPVKTIVKHGGDKELEMLEEKTQPSIVRLEEEDDEDPRIPDAHKDEYSSSLKTEKEEELEAGLVSEDEAERLMKDFQLRENPDGTINFDESSPVEELNSFETKVDSEINSPKMESDMGLWSEKYYRDAENKLDEASNLVEGLDEAILEDVPEQASMASNTKYSLEEDKKLIRSITEELVEKMLKQILPDIAEKLVREEIEKIVGEEK